MPSNNPFFQDLEDAQALQAAGAASMHTGSSNHTVMNSSSNLSSSSGSHSVPSSATNRPRPSIPNTPEPPAESTPPTIVLPPEEIHPDEPPPAYTPMADGEESTTVIPMAGPLILQRPPEDSNSNLRPPPAPPRPGSAGSSHSSFSNQSFPAPSQAPHRPPPGPPPQQYYPGPSSYSPPGGYPGHSAPTFGGQRPPPPPLPFTYPPGYWCPKCRNTGVKLKNGLSCQDCYGRFASQSGRVQYLPQPSMFGGFSSYRPRPVGPSGPPRVVQPGDPSIGGVLCGRCRGRGYVHDFIFEETCPTCRGIGRLF